MHRLARSKIGARGLSKILIKYIKYMVQYGTVGTYAFPGFPWYVQTIKLWHQTVPIISTQKLS